MAPERISEVASEEREKPLHVADVPGLVEPERYADLLADLGRHVGVGRKLGERVAGGECRDRVDDEADDQQRRESDQETARDISTHLARIPVAPTESSGPRGPSCVPLVATYPHT